MRHKCVKFCPLFNIAVMLFSRFKVSNELNRIDFTKNDWFKFKLIANLQSSDKLKHMKDRMRGQFYEKKVKELEKCLKTKLPGVLHLGRRIAVCIMEILQIPLEFIKELGMWNFDVFDEIYSSKLALQALKGISGFKKGPTSYFLNRNEFHEKTSLFILLWPELEGLLEAALNGKNKTAANFVHCLIELRRIIFQDLAYLKIIEQDHWLHYEYPFKTELFNE